MADQTTFETRLEDALDRYADRVPVEFDVPAVVAGASTADPSRAPHRWALRWPEARVWLSVAVAAALLAATVGLVAIIARSSVPQLGGGRLMVSVGTSGWVMDSALASRTQVKVAPDCGTTLVDGGAQLVTTERFKPTRRRPFDADPAVDIGFVSPSIPGYGGSNLERWSPDRTRYAVVRWAQQSDDDPEDGRGAILVVSIHGATVPSSAIFEVQGLVGDVAWSPESNHLAVLRHAAGHVEVVDVDVVRATQRPVAAYREPTSVGFPAIDWADDRHIAVRIGTQSGDAPALVDARSGDVATLRTEESAFDWSPDGSHVIAGLDEASILLARDGTKVADLPRGTPLGSAFGGGVQSWASDSRHLAVADFAGGHLWIIRADGTGAPWGLPLPSGWVPPRPAQGGSQDGAAWSPDGRAIALASFGGAAIEVTLFDVDTHATIASTTMETAASTGRPRVCFQWVPPVD